MEHILVTGAVPGKGLQPSTAERLDAYDFVKNTRLFSLYVRALQGVHDESDEKDLSHFQLGGIHGLPYQQWNGAGPKTGNKGYCFHYTHLFPSWHRPYCALYEATLSAHARIAAAKFEVDRDGWMQAADAFRLPFWDWGLHKLPPKEFYDVDNAARVTIIDYDGNTTTVENPLLSYSFKAGHGPPPPPAEEQRLGPIGKLKSTLRYPTEPLDDSSKTQVDKLEAALDKLGDRTPGDVSRLLLQVDRWYPFSTGAVEPPSGSDASTNSLETIHDGLHVNIGGPYGHMSKKAYAGFDPIFWLHHANVDRVMALWQVIHYNSWILPAKDGDETWTTHGGDLFDENTQLAPFWHTTDSWWTSAQARETTALWYTYPDFRDIDLSKRPEASEAIKARVKKLYGDPSIPGMPGANLKGIEWTCRIRATTADLRDIRSILIFVGEVPDDERELLNSPNYFGSFDPFVNELTTSCSNCAERAGTYIQGFVHMSSKLVERNVNIHDTDATEVYLRDSLSWIIQKSDGSIGAVADIPSLEVTVIDTKLTPPDNDGDSPMISKPREHPGITEGKPGGHRGA